MRVILLMNRLSPASQATSSMQMTTTAPQSLRGWATGQLFLRRPSAALMVDSGPVVWCSKIADRVSGRIAGRERLVRIVFARLARRTGPTYVDFERGSRKNYVRTANRRRLYAPREAQFCACLSRASTCSCCTAKFSPVKGREGTYCCEARELFTRG